MGMGVGSAEMDLPGFGNEPWLKNELEEENALAKIPVSGFDTL